MITRCPVCRSKDLKTVGQVTLCKSCEYIASDLPLEEALQRASSQIKKDKQKKAHAENMRSIQEKQTKKPYLRLQFRIF